MGPYRAGSDVEELTELRDGALLVEEAQHIQLPFRKLPVGRSVPDLALKEFALLALEKIGKMPASGYTSKIARASASIALAPLRSLRAIRTGTSASNPTSEGQELIPGNFLSAERPLSRSVCASARFPRSASTRPSAMRAKLAWGIPCRLNLSKSAPASRASHSASFGRPSSSTTNDRKDSMAICNTGWLLLVSRSPSSRILRDVSGTVLAHPQPEVYQRGPWRDLP